MQLIMDLAYNISAFVLVISLIVFIHEFGHYYVAKLSGVKIEVFSIGFGKEIFGWNDKHGTRWKISYIPLGGYVKMFGDINYASQPNQKEIATMTEQELKKAFYKQSLKIKAMIVAAGPLANFILAILILSVFFWYYGAVQTTNKVTYIVERSRAESAGLKEGDIILSIDNKKVKNFAEIERLISISPNMELTLTIDREGQIFRKKVVPELHKVNDSLGNEINIGKLGIRSNINEYKNYNILHSIVIACETTLHISYVTFKALGQMITGKRAVDEVGGVIRIAKYSGESMKKGIKVLLWFMAILSINLGLMNILPIPMLDGGHLMYYLVEAILGEKTSEVFQRYSIKLGFIIIIMVFLLSTFNDLAQLKLFN